MIYPCYSPNSSLYNLQALEVITRNSSSVDAPRKIPVPRSQKKALVVEPKPAPRLFSKHRQKNARRPNPERNGHNARKNQSSMRVYSFVRRRPTTTYTIVAGGVRTQYDQNIVRLMRRSNASPDAACVICDRYKTR